MLAEHQHRNPIYFMLAFIDNCSSCIIIVLKLLLWDFWSWNSLHVQPDLTKSYNLSTCTFLAYNFISGKSMAVIHTMKQSHSRMVCRDTSYYCKVVGTQSCTIAKGYKSLLGIKVYCLVPKGFKVCGWRVVQGLLFYIFLS